MIDFKFGIEEKEWEKTLKKISADLPQISKKAIRKVNNEVRKKLRREARARGYKAKKPMPYGDAGYSKNILQFVRKDLSAVILIGRNAFQYRFIEFGADVRPRNKKYLTFVGEDGQFHKTSGFTLSARPFLHPIAASIWETGESSKIMDKLLQDELNKRNKG